LISAHRFANPFANLKRFVIEWQGSLSVRNGSIRVSRAGSSSDLRDEALSLYPLQIIDDRFARDLRLGPLLALGFACELGFDLVR
jgi:hypothetical protein